MSILRIMDSNKFFNNAFTVTASSTNTDFPLTNLLNSIRGKVWQSNRTGNYVVNSTNNKIDFNIGGGAVAATITSATYTATTLCAEIVTRLNAAAAGTYTATFSQTTGKFTLTKSTGTFSLLWLTGTNTATSLGASIGFSLAADDTGSLTYTSDTVALHTEEWIKIDLGAATNIDSFALLFDPKEGNKFSGNQVIKLQAHASDSWASPSVNVTLSLDSVYQVYTHFFSSNQSYRYWRILITDPTNSNFYVEVPKLFLSLATQLTIDPEIGFLHTIIDQTNIQENDYGHSYADIYPCRRALAINHKVVPAADIETLYTIYKTVGKHTPICMALDWNATLFDKDRFFIYGTFKKDMQTKHIFYNYFEQDIEIVEAM